MCGLRVRLEGHWRSRSRKARPAYLRAVEQQIENNRNQIVALKAYLGYLPFAPDDPAYANYYAIAEKYNLPVILHTGDTWSTQGRLEVLPSARSR